MSNRRTHSPEIKDRVAMELNMCRDKIHVNQWMRQQLEGVSAQYTSGKKRRDKE